MKCSLKSVIKRWRYKEYKGIENRRFPVIPKERSQDEKPQQDGMQ
jgi:hypothetical protein